MEEGIVPSGRAGEELASGVGGDEIQNSVSLSESRLLLNVCTVLFPETGSNKINKKTSKLFKISGDSTCGDIKETLNLRPFRKYLGGHWIKNYSNSQFAKTRGLQETNVIVESILSIILSIIL